MFISLAAQQQCLHAAQICRRVWTHTRDLPNGTVCKATMKQQIHSGSLYSLFAGMTVHATAVTKSGGVLAVRWTKAGSDAAWMRTVVRLCPRAPNSLFPFVNKTCASLV